MRFQQNASLSDPAYDPAYDAVDREAALLLGPLLIKRWEPRFRNILMEEHEYLTQFDKRTDDSQNRLDVLTKLLHRKGAAR
jgi:hypothetical protein